jgi:hypothetical protein
VDNHIFSIHYVWCYVFTFLSGFEIYVLTLNCTLVDFLDKLDLDYFVSYLVGKITVPYPSLPPPPPRPWGNQ